MPDSINLADEFQAPVRVDAPTVTTNDSVDLMAEFEPPPRQEQHAVINDAADKARKFKSAFSSGDIEQDTIKGVGLLEEWMGRERFQFEKIKDAISNDPGLEGLNRPIVELPLIPEGGAIPLPGGGVSSNPILTGAYNGIAPIASSLTSPLNISMMGTFGALAKVAKGIGPAATAAKAGLRLLQAGFAAEMAEGAGGAVGAASVPDGKSTQQKTADVVGALAQSALTVLAAHGAAKTPEAAVRGEPVNPKAVEEAIAGAPERPASVEPVDIGPRDETVSTGTGVPTPKEEVMLAEQKRLVDDHLAKAPKLEEEFTPPADGSEEAAVITEELAKPTETPELAPEPAKPLEQEFTPPAGDATGIRNAIVDQERKDRGLPPAMEPAAKEFGKSWDAALKEVEKNPNAGADLVTEVLEKPRPLTDEENALLLHRQIEVQNQFDKVSDRITTGDENASPEQRAADATQLAKLSDDLLDIYNAGKLVGTEQGRGLASRKMLANEDYSLAKMTTMRRAVNDGKALTPEQSSEVGALHKKIEDTQKAFDEYVAKAEERFKGLEKKKDGTTNTDQNVISQFIDKQADAARARIRKRQSQGLLYSGIPLDVLADYAIVGAQHIKNGIVDIAAWSAEMVKEFGEKIRPHLQDIYNKSKESAGELETAASKEATRLKSFKTRMAKSIERFGERTAEGDFGPRDKAPALTLDEEAQNLKAANERAKIEFQTALIKDRLASRTNFEKTQDTFVKWRRGFLLSGYSTLAKLTGAAVLRVVTTPLEELVGAGIGKLAPELMERAPRHGGLNSEAEAKAMTAIFTKGMKDAYSVLTTGKSTGDILFGRTPGGNVRPSDVIPQSMIDFFGNLHGALKAPVKASEFSRSLEKRLSHAIRTGVDVSDPAVQQSIAVAAYKDANRAIFMQDNVVSKAFNTGLAALENVKVGGERSSVGKAIATTIHGLLPIVKVPTNIVAEAVEYTVGSVTGSVKLAKAMREGMKDLTPEKADVIARQLKKGSLGAAALLIGYFGRKNFGGFYQQGEKRDKKDVAPGAARVGDVDIGRSLIHSSLMETVQLGATIGRVQDEKVKGQNNSLADSVGLATLGLAEELPFVRTPIELGKLFDKNQREYVKGELVKDLVIPQAVSQAARDLDTDAKGEPIKRKPKTVLEHVETGVPGLRATVRKK